MSTTDVITSKSELQTLLQPWVATLRQRSANTARSYEQAVSNFLDQLPDKGPIGPEQIAAYLDSLSGLAPATRAHHISAVKSYLRFGQRQGAVATSILDYLVRPRVTVTSFNRYLTLEELVRLIAAARELGPRAYAAVMLMAGTGVRVEEAATTVWRDLFRDPQGRLGLRVLGKGSKERVVAIREEDVFAALVALHGSDKLDARDTTPLLPSRLGRAYTTRGLRKLIVTAGELAKLDKHVSPHWLRHTHGTLAALGPNGDGRGGASAFAIQASLGHARLETSQRYVHWARGLEETSVSSLPSFTG
jgi:integrase/recombinase XerD